MRKDSHCDEKKLSLIHIWTFDPKLVEDVQKAAEGFHLFFSCMYHSFDFFINNVAKIMLPCLL